jgi:hypothetical protein
MNVGRSDRIIRAIMGIVLIGLALFSIYDLIVLTLSTFWTVVLIVVGAILLLNAIFGYSVLYALFRLDTSKAEEPTNIGHIDRIVRAVVGIVLLDFALFSIYNVVAVTLSTFWAVVLILAGTLLLLTAILGYSVLYGLFRLNTYTAEERICPIPHARTAQ